MMRVASMETKRFSCFFQLNFQFSECVELVVAFVAVLSISNGIIRWFVTEEWKAFKKNYDEIDFCYDRREFKWSNTFNLFAMSDFSMLIPFD